MIEAEKLREINERLASVDVKGKDYVQVNQRVKGFRELCPNGTIKTDILSLEDGVVTMKATITDEEGKILATGLAQEKESSSFINRTSFIENCETSAIGRALGFIGIGIETSVASAEEVQNAMNNQDKPAKKDSVEEAELKAKVLGYFNRHGFDQEKLDSIAKLYKIKSVQDMNAEQCRHYISQLEKNGGSIDE